MGTAKAIFDAVLFDGVRDDVAILTIAVAPLKSDQTSPSIARWLFDVRDADAARNVRSALTDLLESERFSAEVDVAVDRSAIVPALHVLDRGPGFGHSSAAGRHA